MNPRHLSLHPHKKDLGGGFVVRRLLPAAARQAVGPFLFFDHFGPIDVRPEDLHDVRPHPHIGLATVTYLFDGAMLHRDSTGAVQRIEPGAINWMTAGRGIVHSEMPEQQDGAMEGFQLWLNLPARSKMIPPWYRDIAPAEIPEWQGQGVLARVIAGRTHGVAGAMQREGTEPLYLDLHLAPGATFEQPLPAAHNAFVYVYRGELAIAGTPVPRRRMAILANTPGSDGVALHAGADGARAILIAGRPLNEPIAQYGPFVMNTQQEIFEAVQDFQAGRLG